MTQAAVAPLGESKPEWEIHARLAEWIEGRSEVRVTAPGTDIRLGIEGRKFIPCDGEHNMPDGEFFTGPIEDSVEGEVTFHLPAVVGGRELPAERVAELFVGSRGLAIQSDVITRFAHLWVSYLLFADRMLAGDSLLDSAAVLAANPLWMASPQSSAPSTEGRGCNRADS